MSAIARASLAVFAALALGGCASAVRNEVCFEQFMGKTEAGALVRRAQLHVA